MGKKRFDWVKFQLIRRCSRVYRDMLDFFRMKILLYGNLGGFLNGMVLEAVLKVFLVLLKMIHFE